MKARNSLGAAAPRIPSLMPNHNRNTIISRNTNINNPSLNSSHPNTIARPLRHLSKQPCLLKVMLLVVQDKASTGLLDSILAPKSARSGKRSWETTMDGAIVSCSIIQMTDQTHSCKWTFSCFACSFISYFLALDLGMWPLKEALHNGKPDLLSSLI